MANDMIFLQISILPIDVIILIYIKIKYGGTNRISPYWAPCLWSLRLWTISPDSRSPILSSAMPQTLLEVKNIDADEWKS